MPRNRTTALAAVDPEPREFVCLDCNGLVFSTTIYGYDGFIDEDTVGNVYCERRWSTECPKCEVMIYDDDYELLGSWNDDGNDCTNTEE